MSLSDYTEAAAHRREAERTVVEAQTELDHQITTYRLAYVNQRAAMERYRDACAAELAAYQAWRNETTEA